MHIEGSFLFVGIEDSTPLIPGIPVGKIRGWNLDNPSAPPFEFMVSPEMPFAHLKNVMALTVAKDAATGSVMLFSGSADGSIRYWVFDSAINTFKCVGAMEGHVRGVTRLKTFQQGPVTA